MWGCVFLDTGQIADVFIVYIYIYIWRVMANLQVCVLPRCFILCCFWIWRFFVLVLLLLVIFVFWEVRFSGEVGGPLNS